MTGGFGPHVEKDYFAQKISGINIRKINQFLEWTMPYSFANSINHNEITERIIPTGTIGMIQPLDSLVHNQVSSPRFTNLFKYSWFESRYIEERLPEFENPVEYRFHVMPEKCDLCDEVAVFKCA
ncbi:hypothetical protein ABEB36_008304 [Hypothenemus hampei]|uniref:Uncharacterized protein n=1 Tax=Hypothenemus hampei TaxID=57062 RepID=A0ABD1EM22_HYPHA